MYEYDSLFKEIQINCILNSGNAFDMDSVSTVYWHKTYRGKKFFFESYWEYVRSESAEKLKEVTDCLSKLPEGITYSERCVKTNQLPECIYPYGIATEQYITEFSIHISKDFSQKIYNKFKGNQIVILADFADETYSRALEFKNKVLSVHPEIIPPLYKNGLCRFSFLSNDGFTNFDSGYGLALVNMKPLQYDYQRLGLALAVAEYGLNYIEHDQIYVIDTYSTNSFPKTEGIQFSIHRKKTLLRDW